MKKHIRKTVSHRDQWLRFSVSVALATFLVLSSTEVLNYAVDSEGGDSTINTAQMRAFDRGQYYFNYNGNVATYDLGKARQAYTEVLLQSSGEVSSAEIQMAWYQLGRIDFLEGRFNEAIWKFEYLVHEYNDPMPNVHYMLGLAHGYKAKSSSNNESSWSLAEEEFEKFLASIPNSPWGRTDLAWVYFAQGKFDAMVSVLEAGLQFEPQNPWLLNMYGLALLNLNNPSAAYEVLQKAEASAGTLSVEAWGSAYPGNDPRVWGSGLDSFQDVIAKNKELASEAMETQ